MNIAFLTTLNPADINNWSGTTFHLFHALSRKHHVKVIGQNTLLQAAYFTKDNYIKKNPLENYVSVFGKLCTEQLTNYDLVFFGDLYLAPFLDVNVPVVHLSDVTYHSFQSYLNPLKNEEQIKKIEMMEKKLLNKYTAHI